MANQVSQEVWIVCIYSSSLKRWTFLDAVYLKKSDAIEDVMRMNLKGRRIRYKYLKFIVDPKFASNLKKIMEQENQNGS